MPLVTKQDKDWIEECGSNYLQHLVELGLPCHALYIQERTQIEFPGFQITDRKLHPLQQYPSTKAQIIINDHPTAFLSEYDIDFDTVIYKEVVALPCPFSEGYLFKPIKKDRTAKFRQKFKLVFKGNFGNAIMVAFLISILVISFVLLLTVFTPLNEEFVGIVGIIIGNFLSYRLGHSD